VSGRSVGWPGVDSLVNESAANKPAADVCAAAAAVRNELFSPFLYYYSACSFLIDTAKLWRAGEIISLKAEERESEDDIEREGRKNQCECHKLIGHKIYTFCSSKI